MPNEILQETEKKFTIMRIKSKAKTNTFLLFTYDLLSAWSYLRSPL